MTHDAIEQHILQVDLPIELISEMLGALAEATMDLIVVEASYGKQVSRRWI